MLYGFDYDIAELTRAKNFSEYDESAWDYFDDDEYNDFELAEDIMYGDLGLEMDYIFEFLI